MFSLVNHFGIREAGFIEGNIIFCNIIRHIPEGQFDTFHAGVHFPQTVGIFPDRKLYILGVILLLVRLLFLAGEVPGIGRFFDQFYVISFRHALRHQYAC